MDARGGGTPKIDNPRSGGTLKIDNARYVVTVDDARRVIRDGAVVARDGTITHIGKADELRDIGADVVIDARGGVVTPAFVNGHMHISYAHAVRGLFPDDFVGRERLREVFRLQSAMTEDEEYWTSLLAIIELVRSGTVTLCDPGSTKFVDACMQVYADSGVRVVTGLSLIDRESDLMLPRFATGEALRRTREFIQTFDGRLGGRVRAFAMPFSSDTCSPELLRGAKDIADELGTWITIHHSGGLTAQLSDGGVLGPNVLLAHAPDISDDEVSLIADSGASVVMCPSTTMKEGSGLGRRKLPELRARGVAVGLGADSGNSSNYLDAVRMMNAAALGLKDGRLSVAAVSAEACVEMATRDGAAALGFGSVSGALEVGRAADLVVFETRRADWSALFDVVNNLVYSAGAGSVRTVVAGGRVVVDEGRVTFADEAQVAERVQEIGEALLARTGTRVNTGRWQVI